MAVVSRRLEKEGREGTERMLVWTGVDVSVGEGEGGRMDT